MLKVTVDRPTNTTDSVSLVREWLYNRRSELAAATGGRLKNLLLPLTFGGGNAKLSASFPFGRAMP